MTDNQPHEYSGQTFHGPLIINGSLEMNPTIMVAHKDWVLDRYDFDKIVNGECKWLLLMQAMLGAAIGFFINMIAKLIANKIDNSIPFDLWEVWAFAISMILMGVCFTLNKYSPNKRRQIVNKIERHFERTQNGQ